MTVLVAPCEADAARWAVKHWHYSKRMPTGPKACYGVWEGDRFIGAVIYARGASPQAHRPFDVARHEVVELMRVALDRHETPVTQIVAESLRLLKRDNPGLRVVVSYADPAEGHAGRIYAAGGWVYLGVAAHSKEAFFLLPTGEVKHNRRLMGRKATMPDGTVVRLVDAVKEWGAVPIEAWKHAYAMGLDKQMKRRLAKLARPAPAKATDYAPT